jgi:hypothetical protein
MRKALLTDVEQLVTMMAEFYSDSPYRLNPRRAADAFRSLLADERLGRVWFIQSGLVDTGHAHLALGLAEPTHAA